MSSDQCSIPMLCRKKPLEEQTASLEDSAVEKGNKDYNFSQVSDCSYCMHMHTNKDVHL